MPELRDFDAEYDYSSRPGIQFKLGGELFTTKPIAPVKAFITGDKTGFDMAMEFFRCVLIPEDAVRFAALIDDENILISAAQIDQIASWLMGELSGKVTGTPASSGNGAGQTSTTSPGGSPLEVVTSG